ncbi:S1 domain-containing RNA-binding protein [Eremococcus coleocola]|uniref:S1 RNA binding domain protein n=1 Tax=Eremococcus coleocola ACS-139-V-Col8 TaxID=908337 RepID=E4KMT8_9LACT|nr:S1 domain-containing RNA-binding protein [Eremococcus coleocola]EFR31670.1 S1 RNA binding domain protein [Eremococcus coleocola ACS-139-V-Col8]
MSLEVGAKVKGKVVSVKNFGAFVSLSDNESGLVHISQLSNSFVKDINDFIKVGDEVEVKVIKIMPDGKINLSMKDDDAKASDDKKQSKNFKPRPKKDDFHKKDSNNFANGPKNKPKFVSSSNHSFSESSTNDFDQMMNRFLKDSEDRLTSLKRNTEGKRGGRGGRRT